jgi:hypothetical protein
VGRGYHRQYSSDHEAALQRARAGATDPDPLLKTFPTFFHRLGATAEEIASHLETDAREGADGYQEWYSTLKSKFTKKATKAAAAEVDEKWMIWKAKELDRLAADHRKDIAVKTREKGKDFVIEMAEKLDLQVTRKRDLIAPIPTIGRKRTALGSAPQPTLPTPPSPTPTPPPLTPTPPPPTPPSPTSSTPRATRISLPRLAKRTTSNSPAPRGRVPTPISQPPARVDPSPTPRPKKNHTAAPTAVRPNLEEDAAALTATVLTKILTRLEALERLSMPPPPVRHPETRSRQNHAWTAPPDESNTRGSTSDTLQVPQTAEEEEGEFTTVSRNGKGKKGKGKSTPPQINLTPASYASAAASAANTKQPAAPPKTAARLPTITEVTVLRAGNGGHPDPEVELNIRIRAADAIVREVRLKMSNAVSNPIPLRAGRWSVQARSKGNFVYSFDGNVPFDTIKSYEHILLAPFYGTGKLSPSMGWTRLLAHGVPVFDENWFASGPEELLREVKMMPGLKKAHFAMPPRWLKPVERIETDYSTITFAISDPDGSITNTLLMGRAALFGKEVVIQRWVDKPALVQCSHCHALGHIRTSRACPLGKDSVKCYICGGSHLTETHSQKCKQKHAVAGICDCSHFKCLNCQKTGHNCKDTRCPARDLFRPRPSRKPRGPRNKGKDRDWTQIEEPNPAPPNITEEDPFDEEEDLYNPAPLPPNPTRRQVRTALHDKSIAGLCGPSSFLLVDEENTSGSSLGIQYNPEEFPEALNNPEPMDMNLAPTRSADYSPSRPQSVAANETIA